MAQYYSSPSRGSDPYALPNIETWEIKARKGLRRNFQNMGTDPVGNVREPGWYYWFCFPGCIPDSDPIGPFETEAEALADAREGLEE